MTAKEYLSQAKHLDDFINCRLRELEYWRDLSLRVSGGSFEERHNPNRLAEAPFVRCLDKIDEIGREINSRLDDLVNLRSKIGNTIDAMENRDERLLLRCRYLEGLSWEKIADILRVSPRTAHRIHKSALQHFSVPD